MTRAEVTLASLLAVLVVILASELGAPRAALSSSASAQLPALHASAPTLSTPPPSQGEAAPVEEPVPSREAPRDNIGTAVVGGPASYVDASYGPLYLALPSSPRGTRVRICHAGRCVERTSNDVGPVKRLHRVADLSFRDFAYLCGCAPKSKGLLGVSVEFLNGRPQPTIPPTDAG